MKIFSEAGPASPRLDEVQCNLCGRRLKKNDFGYFEDHLSVSKTWGYESPIDGEAHEFDLCIECYSELIGRFKLPPNN